MFGLALAAAVPAAACSVPVFRYSLERWPAEPYRVYVFHRGALSPETQKLVDRLQTAAGTRTTAGPIELAVIDVAGKPDEDAAAIYKRHESATLPLMVVCYPADLEIAAEVWAGPLAAEAVDRLLDSPARRQIAKRIIEGEAGVFLVLESGDRAKDDAAADLLKTELARLEKVLKLPAPDDGQWGDPVYDEKGPPPLRLAFSFVRMARSDPAEAMFVKMLLGAGPIPGSDEGPVVFPFFGRGRALAALAGKNFDAAAIEDVCEFMGGPCSCIIKGQNPGVDMLMNVDWDAALAGQESAIPKVEPPPLTGVGAFAKAGAAATEGDARTSLWQNVAVAVVVGVAIIAVLAAVMARRRRGSGSN